MNCYLNKGSHLAVRHFLSLLIIFLLSGCGFQLKGSDSQGINSSLMGKTIHFTSSQPRSELTRTVANELNVAGVFLLDNPTIPLRLSLGPEKFSQRNLSLSAKARAAELELNLSTDFSLQQSNLETISANISVSRQMVNDPRNVVGKTEELRLLRVEMRRDLATQLVRRLDHALSP